MLTPLQPQRHRWLICMGNGPVQRLRLCYCWRPSVELAFSFLCNQSDRWSYHQQKLLDCCLSAGSEDTSLDNGSIYNGSCHSLALLVCQFCFQLKAQNPWSSVVFSRGWDTHTHTLTNTHTKASLWQQKGTADPNWFAQIDHFLLVLVWIYFLWLYRNS